MPEIPEPKVHAHPWHTIGKRRTGVTPSSSPAHLRACGPSCLPLSVTTNFTFLTGASHPEEMVQRAAELGHGAVAITDTNTLAGVVRAHLAAKKSGIQLIVGCRLVFHDVPGSVGLPSVDRAAPCFHGHAPSCFSVLAYPTDAASYSRLCRLLTLGRRRAPKGQCHLVLHDLLRHQEGLVAVLVVPEVMDQNLVDVAVGLVGVFDDDRLSVAAPWTYGQDDRTRLAQVAALSVHLGVPMVAAQDVCYHVPCRRPLHDVLACIRMGCTLDEAGFALRPNAEAHLKSNERMQRFFAAYPDAVARTMEIARRTAGYSLDQLKYQYPQVSCPPGRTAMQHLVELAWQGASDRYPQGVPAKVRRQIKHEFQLIGDLNYAPYFLTVHDLVVHARSRGILCQGRGAAANSAVCYCLGVTSVDPDRIDVLFERFVSRERHEPPDIDIDFEHQRREEVIQYIYRRYGRDRAALTAEVVTYRGRSAVREVGRVLGLPRDHLDRLAGDIDGGDVRLLESDQIRDAGFSSNDPMVRHLVRLASEILGFPRHLSQHVGGFVITHAPLSDLVPIQNAAMEDRTMIEWDKNDIDAMGMLKVDVLGLGMLTCIQKCLSMVNERSHDSALRFDAIAPEDPAVYDMICAADTVGVFQIESRAQMSMLPRLRPRSFYDLVIEVAIVRPGPIQGNMVHPYLRRRAGEEPVDYPDEKVRRILGKTLGIPMFQEQAMQLVVVAAGFTPGEADQLRRAIAAWSTKEKVVHAFGKKIIDGMTARGYGLGFARRCFEQIKGFSEYGFPESHAASFALIVYVSAWLKKYHPAAFAASLLNSQPMGFYAPAQIVRDVQLHGVVVHPVDVNHSGWDCSLEERENVGAGKGPALRLGMRMVKGLRQQEAEAVKAAVRNGGAMKTIEQLWRCSGTRVATLRCLASADAFGSMGLDRQAALWQARALRDENGKLFMERDTVSRRPKGEGRKKEGGAGLPKVTTADQVRRDYATVGLSLKAHPVSFVRKRLGSMRAVPCDVLHDDRTWPNGRAITVGGLVLVRQRPSAASGIVFMTIEDETGMANLIVRPKVFQRDRKAARHGAVVAVEGHVERRDRVVHVMVHRFLDVGQMLDSVAIQSRNFH